MDNFLDRIAQKLNATDVIKANTAAEESETKRLKIKVGEYEKLLVEMRQVNVHNAELSSKMKSAFDQLSDLIGGLEQLSIQSPPDLGSSDILTDELRTEIIDVIIKNGAQALEKSTARLVEMSGEISMWLQQSQQRNEETVMRLQQSGEFTENIMTEISGILAKNKEAAKKIDEQLNRYDKDLERSGETNERGAEIVNQMGQIIQRSASDTDKIFNLLENLNNAIKTLGEKDNNSGAAFSELSAKIEDFVHKENVKVYRNVQAAVEENIKSHGDTVGADLSAMKQDIKTHKLYLILAIVFSVGSCAVSVLSALNVF